MHRSSSLLAWVAPLLFTCVVGAQIPDYTAYARDPRQAIDAAYSAKIRQYTTDPSFGSSLVNDLPASKSVPTPAKVLGDVAGAPNMLPYAEDVYKYFRLLAAASPRVQVVTIGHTEEGREMIAVAIADEALFKGREANGTRLAQLADPRKLGLDDAKAHALIAQSFPVYYITGTIHSTETGAPTALMELAYRLAVDESPYIKHIRSHMITLITPVVEVDGRDRMVDLYRWHRAHPNGQYPHLIYWGHYVAHDNNRDAMAMTLDLTRNVLDTYLGWHAQVLHDLHESVPFLYDNTVGDGPYNAWIDPILADEWAELGWNNVAQVQAQGMPGVFTHGDFDTWSPGYLMFLAGMHNGISRLYETFGNGGADTEKRILTPEEYSRTWYRQNPPLPQVMWSQRDNNNYEETALLTTLSYFSNHTEHFLENFYLKSKRSLLKPSQEGPAAYVFPADQAELNRQLQLLEILGRQHVEVHRLLEDQTVTLPPKKAANANDRSRTKQDEEEQGKGDPDKDGASKDDPDKDGASKDEPNKDDASKDNASTEDASKADTKDSQPRTVHLPAGSFVVRMDQPFSRIADALLDRQFWAPDDPQKHPYDDTGWNFPALFNLHVDRVTDPHFLQSRMEPVGDLDSLRGKLADGHGEVVAVPNTGQSTLLTLVYKLGATHVLVTEQATSVDGKALPAGSLLLQGVDTGTLTPLLHSLSLDAVRLGSKPSVGTHAAAAPRVAFMHSWLSTQTEGWWRYAFDHAGVPYDYINVQTAAATSDLRAKYDVILFAPVGRATSSQILNGLPTYGNAMPWQRTELTPNLGRLDQTADTRAGLSLDGVAHLKDFVSKGGLLITCEDTAQFAIDLGLAPGVTLAPKGDARVVGSVLKTEFVDKDHPIAAGYAAAPPILSAEGMVFNISNTVDHSGARLLMDPYEQRPTGRGSVGDADVPQGRRITEPEPIPKPKPWQARPLNEEQTRNNPNVIPEPLRPEVILRLGGTKGLLLSGLLDKAGSIAEHAIVVDAPFGQGNVLLFANNPVYRGETVGTYPLVFNALMNFDHLRHQPTTDSK